MTKRLKTFQDRVSWRKSPPSIPSLPEDASFSTSPLPGAPHEEGHSVTVPSSAPPDAQPLASPLPAAMHQLAGGGAKTVTADTMDAAQDILSD